MPRVTASSLERSLQNCSLSCSTSSSGLCDGVINNNNNNKEVPSSSSSSSDENSTFLQLNSHISLPYHWEQCLDLKTGELYYINWSTGKKAKEDPRTTRTGYNGDYYSSSAEDDKDYSSSPEEEEEESSQEESSSCSSTTQEHFNFNFRRTKYQLQQQRHQEGMNKEEVLVVAGCKGCFMYYMVPKHVDECPKCAAQLLHFPSNNDN